MPEVLVETKLLRPRPRDRTVSRPRLDELLQLGRDATLVLVSAPAGFGKTTLLSTWLAAEDDGRSTAWVSLDERDRDAGRFWTYVLLATERAAPGSAAAALTLLGSGRTPIDSALTALLNELSVLPHDVNLVLDDYHLADGPDVRTGMTFLVDHLPPQVHLVISSRADPGLPLARLRARGELVEIRAAELRFTDDEARAYLNELHSLSLEPSQVAALESRTEGWAAALQLAVLSLRGREDRATFIAGFTGGDRYVVDYLADEVLDRQPPDVRRFLLDTSVLDRLTPSLCEAVTGVSTSRSMLEQLERQNLFLVPLDARRHWYRYHQLFADVLRARLLEERPADVPVLHRRASAWYDEADDPEAAVRHALAAGDVGLAADRAEVAIRPLLRERREAVVCRWVEEFPADIVQNRPVLAVGFIAGLTESNRFDGLDERLADAERMLAGPVDEHVVVDQTELPRLPAAIATYRAALSLVDGDLEGTVTSARLALDRAPADDRLTMASASALLGLAALTAGDLDAAHRAYRLATETLHQVGHIPDVLGCSITVGDIEITQGKLTAAQRTYRRGLDLAATSSSPTRGVADMYVGLSRVALERGDLTGAAAYLHDADKLGESGGLPQNPHRWRTAMALLRHAENDSEAALDLLEEAGELYVADFNPDLMPVPAIRARIMAAAGDVAGSMAWVESRGISPRDELSYIREYEHITLARVLLTLHDASGDETCLADATQLVDRLLDAALAGGRTGVAIEVSVLQALARDASGDREAALDSLEQALRWAEPEHYALVFTRVNDLLRALSARHPQWKYVGQLRAATTPAPATARDTADPTPSSQDLIDPLSSRELDVLRYLGSDLDGPAIARELGVSLSTVRTHTQHIYTKLGVNSRRAAVRRAHDLRLLRSRPARRA